MGMFAALNGRISRLQLGLQPETLKYWHHTILREARSNAPPWLQDRINITQDPHLPMKFNLDISKRVVITLHDGRRQPTWNEMPPSTRLYFLRVCEALGGEIDKNACIIIRTDFCQCVPYHRRASATLHAVCTPSSTLCRYAGQCLGLSRYHVSTIQWADLSRRDITTSLFYNIQH